MIKCFVKMQFSQKFRAKMLRFVCNFVAICDALFNIEFQGKPQSADQKISREFPLAREFWITA